MVIAHYNKKLRVNRMACYADTHTYIGYYNTQRIHTTIGDMTSIEFEKRLNKVSGFI